MTEAALWGQVRTLIDNSDPRKEPEAGSAYEMPIESGPAKPRGFGSLSMAEGKEPYAVWLMVVGSIVILFLLGKGFKTAKA